MMASGLLLPFAIALSACGALLAPLVPARWAARLALLVFLTGNLAALAIEIAVYRAGEPLLQPIGDLLLRADGLAAALLGATALVVGAVGLYTRQGVAGQAPRAARAFWGLLLALSAALARCSSATTCSACSWRWICSPSRRPAGLPGRPRRDAGRGAALPAVRPARLRRCPARLRAALWRATARWISLALGGLVRAEPATIARRGADDRWAAGARPRCSRCISGCRRRMAAPPPRSAPCSRRWW